MHLRQVANSQAWPGRHGAPPRHVTVTFTTPSAFSSRGLRSLIPPDIRISARGLPHSPRLARRQALLQPHDCKHDAGALCQALVSQERGNTGKGEGQHLDGLARQPV